MKHISSDNLDGVHLSRRATSAPDTDSASLFLLIFFFFFVATLCVNKDIYNLHRCEPLQAALVPYCLALSRYSAAVNG